MSQAAIQLLERMRAQGVSLAGLSADSRSVAPGEAFLAFPGQRSDGRRFIAEALARGPSAVLWEALGGQRPEHCPVPEFGVEGLRELSGFLADEVYGRPSEQLWLAGVTGTNGKTTVSQWLARALTDLGLRCGVIGTLGTGFPGALKPGLNTTPDAIALHRLLVDFLREKAGAAAMEVSSIGLDQGRVNGARFDLAIHTNLTRDHLDYHGSMERYAEAKAKLFEFPDIEASIINLDDNFGLALARRLVSRGARVIGYTQIDANLAAVPGAEILAARGVRTTAAGLQFEANWGGGQASLHPRMVARFNVSNLLAVLAALLQRGVSLEEAATVAARMTPPEGRMQLVGGIGEPLVIIDYAHTPDALAQVLEAARGSAEARRGRLTCVFGCGGDRDAGKRPMMGEVARTCADRVLITSDNPRSEDPLAILVDIAAGAGAHAEQVVDRSEAILRAVLEAGANDVVVVAGKGHEPYQEVHGQRLPYSDIAEVRKALQAWERQQEGRA
ncbi:MAG: UDP-N-acetylmuramoyl-L-alanyl-D-glutamate--2,6-diaminopimelate ligase [Zoogloeaceae bacterium]|nr:UDP-N-acetylmuramoyl-L-alanyl-D-glutamate--2,6-diaminopimelate ligase [Zoogloeaceae bacterium]MCP5255728.1 UDP-N-acetylmuramoyl-L-alanyl-D-glutamate--2,6-diaminopimelate ligase [Zoogloeaceae bacterium]